MESCMKYRALLNDSDYVSPEAKFIKMRCRCKKSIDPSGFININIISFQCANVSVSVVSTDFSDLKKEIGILIFISSFIFN